MPSDLEADTFIETTVTAVAGVGRDDVVEGALLGAAASQTDNDHIKLPQKIYILKSLKIRLLTPENT